MAVNLTDAQKQNLTAQGIDWQKLLGLLKDYGPAIVALIEAILAGRPAPLAQHAAFESACPCPDGGCGPDCCCACNKYLAKAIEFNSDGCCDHECHKNCCHALHYELKALECTLAHCCHQ